jgi:hypothetical protein
MGRLPDGDVVTETAAGRLRRWLAGVFAARVRRMTAAEHALTGEVNFLTRRVSELTAQVAAERHDRKMREAELEIAKMEIKLLSAVHDRDVNRVKAESVAYQRAAGTPDHPV